MGVRTDARLPFSKIDEDFLAPRDPILGYIKVGGKSSTIRYARGSGKPWVAPTRFTEPAHFQVTTREKLVERVKGQGKAKGEEFTVDLGYKRDDDFHTAIDDAQPSALRVRLLYPTWEENLVSFLGAYGRSAWTCRGNGVEAIDTARGACACPCPRLAQFEGKYDGTPPKDKLICKPHGQLNVLLEDAEVFGGFWSYKTTSYESISNLIKSLQNLQKMFGRVDGLPLELRVMAATKSYGGGTTTQPIVALVLAASMGTARQLGADAAEESRKYLPAGTPDDAEKYREAVVSEMEDEAESYAGEFMPKEEAEGSGPDSDRNTEEGRAEVGRGAVADTPEGSPAGPARAEEPARARPDPDDEPGGDNGPDFEIVDEDEEDRLEGAADGTAGSGKSTGEPLPPSAPEGVLEATLRAVLTEAGWDDEANDARVKYHVGTRTLETLRDRLERTMPEAWATVTAPGFLKDDEPDDGLEE